MACLAIVTVSALCDLATRRIPNILTLGGVVLGVSIHTAVGWATGGAHDAFRGASFAVLGAVLCAVIPLMGFARGEMGGGDVKLFAAIGALAGPSLGFDAQAFAFAFALLVLWPWRLVRAGALRQVARGMWTKLRARLLLRPPPSSSAPVAVAPVVLGPTILIGLCAAIVRHGGLP